MAVVNLFHLLCLGYVIIDISSFFQYPLGDGEDPELHLGACETDGICFKAVHKQNGQGSHFNGRITQLALFWDRIILLKALQYTCLGERKIGKLDA